MKSGTVHLGHPDFQEAGPCSQWTRETDQEADLPIELQFQSLPETLPGCHPGRKGRRPAASRSAESNRRRAGAVAPSPPSAVTGGTCSHSKCPTKAAKHGQGCTFSSSQRSCSRSQRRHRTRSQKQDEDQPAAFAFSALILATMRPRSKRYTRRPQNLQSSDTRQPWRKRTSTSARGATSRPKIRAPTTVAWKTTRRSGKVRHCDPQAVRAAAHRAARSVVAVPSMVRRAPK